VVFIRKRYTDDVLLDYLIKFYTENDRIPVYNDFRYTKNFPDPCTYINHFGSWNNALQFAGLNVNKFKNKLTGEEYCEICKSTETSLAGWYYRDDLRICSKCHDNNRYYLHGIMNPKSNIGIGIITEYIVCKILKCFKCNTYDNFNAPYDLISEKYGTINVKSSKLYKRNNANSFVWEFSKHENSKIPDYYVCVGFNENRYEILKIWIIEGDSNLVTKRGICITNSEIGLKRVKKYEVNHIIYNEMYKNLDITTLPEFRNIEVIT